MLSAAASRAVVLPLTALASAGTSALLISNSGASGFAYVSLIGSLFLLIPFSDLGLGAAVINAVAVMPTRKDELHARGIATKSFRILCIVALVIVAIAGAIGLGGQWAELLGVSGPLSAQADWAVPFVLAIYALSIPFGLGQRMLVGLKLNHVAGLFGVAGPVAGLALTLLVVKTHAPILLAAAATPFGILIVALVSFEHARRKLKWPRAFVVSRLDLHDSFRVWATALPMLVITLTIPIATQSDKLLLSHLSNSGALAEYSLASQFYNPAYSIISMMAITLWPMFASSKPEDRPQAFGRSLLFLAISGGLVATIFAVLLPLVATFISGGVVQTPISLAVGFAVLIVIMSAHQPSAMLLTDPHGLRFQAWTCVVMMIVNLTVSIALTPHLGALGPVAGSAIAVACCQLFPCLLRARCVLRRERSQFGSTPAVGL